MGWSVSGGVTRGSTSRAVVNATLYAMNRVRISTTVDADRLRQCRQLLRISDSRLVDRALAALLQEIEAARESAALEKNPYEEDPDLSWEVPPGPPLPYDGDVPAEVVDLARRRRRR